MKNKKKHIVIPFWISKGPYVLLYIVLFLVTLPMYRSLVNQRPQADVVTREVAGIQTDVREQVFESLPTPTMYVEEMDGGR